MKKYLSFLSFLTIANISFSHAETPHFAKPLDIPLYLSGNFGELRNNHFHSGIDIKTQGRIGLPVFSVDDGYVSRVTVSPWGFGRAVYITHPSTGLTTVYGHLDSFAPFIDKKVRDIQYERETFTVDLTFKAGEISVKRGERIALSGNAGSSGGPHLHLDVRDRESGDAMDPMPYFKGHIKDNVAPEMRAIALYPVVGKGSVNGESSATTLAPATIKEGFKAWGQVIPAIKAYDKMTDTHNIYGIKYLTLTVDGEPVYRRTIDRFSFDDTKAIHTLVDNDGVVNKGSWMMWTHVPKSNPLDYMIETSQPDGVLTIDEERPYKCSWTLTDEHGNSRVIQFTITGQRQEIVPEKAKGDLFEFNGRNTYSDNGLKVIIEPSTLYDDIYFSVDSATSESYLTPVYRIGDRSVPLRKDYTIVMDIPNDTVVDKSKYVMVRLNGKRRNKVDACYDNGTMTASPSAFGSFAITTDRKAPVITPVNNNRWGRTGIVKFKISDNLSGIKEYRGEIDGKYALFELDGKTGTLSFKMDASKWDKGKRHNIKLHVTDACGNDAGYDGSFIW